MDSTFLVPVNGDWSDKKAVNLACDFAKISKGKVIVLYVIEMARDLPVDAEVNEATARGEEILKRIEELTQDKSCEIEAELLQARQVGPAVVQEAAERGIDTIILGSQYKMKFGSFSLGNALPYILKNAPCKVLLWRGAINQTDSDDKQDSTIIE